MKNSGAALFTVMASYESQEDADCTRSLGSAASGKELSLLAAPAGGRLFPFDSPLSLLIKLRA
jgi:hypothetical protein